MAKKCLVVKCQSKRQKYKVRQYTRCQVCGRPRGVYRRFMLCRICFRSFAHRGLIPGVVKASW